MSLIDELLRKSKKGTLSGDIPPLLERITTKKSNTPKYIYLILFLVILTATIIISGRVEFKNLFFKPRITTVTSSPDISPSQIAVSQKTQELQGGETVTSSPIETESSGDQKTTKKSELSFLPPKSSPVVTPATNVAKTETKAERTQLHLKPVRRTHKRQSLPFPGNGDSILSNNMNVAPEQSPSPITVKTERLRADLLYRANTFEKKGQYHDAIEYYEKVLKLQPDDFRIMNQIAYLYIKLHKPDKAIEYTERIEQIKSLYIPSMINKAVAFMQKAEFHEAERILLKILEIEPYNRTAIYNIGLVYENTQSLDKAKEFYKRLCKMGDLMGREGLKRIELKKPEIEGNKTERK